MSKKLVAVLFAALLVGNAFAAGETETAKPVSTGPTPLSVWAVIAAEIPLVTEEIAAWNVIEQKTNTDLSWKFVSSLQPARGPAHSL